MEEVARGQGVGGVEVLQVVGEQEGAGYGDGHHLVRVDGDGICEVGADEFVFLRRREDERTAPARVDVEPAPIFLADFCDGSERVEGTEDRGSSGGVDVEGCLAHGSGVGDLLVEGGREHGSSNGIDGNGYHGGGAETASLCGFLDGVMCMDGCEEDEFQTAVVVPVDFGGGVEGVAGYDDGGQV